MKILIILSLLSGSLSAYARMLKASDDLFDLQEAETRGKNSQRIYAESIYDYEEFVASDVNSPYLTPYAYSDSHKPKVLSEQNALIALNRAMSNPVVSLDRYSKYDPNNDGIGFCFGRAMFVNLYLAMANFNRANIKKAFVIGPMSDGSWQWHVTTIVQSVDKRGKEIWLAIDPVVGYVIEVKSWYKNWMEVSDDGKLRLYITESGKFAADPSIYDEDDISNEFYNNYFRDMRRWFSKNDVSHDLDF